ncbi:MAG TPA: polysaccharide deacetylase family protein [Noviherbaspirillum sp.]
MPAIFSISIDDGGLSDIRVAEILARHGMRGTFFIPIHNREGARVLGQAQIREIGRQFELGSHTYDHCFLDAVDWRTAGFQVRQGKHRLEEMTGAAVPGFCYPGGKFSKAHESLVAEAGFHYARSTRSLCLDIGRRYAMGTTCQFYPHAAGAYVRNYLRQGDWAGRRRGLLAALRGRDWLSRIYALFELACDEGGVFHLWGHSGDFDNCGIWDEFEAFIAYAGGCIPQSARMTNLQLANLALEPVLQVGA